MNLSFFQFIKRQAELELLQGTLMLANCNSMDHLHYDVPIFGDLKFCSIAYVIIPFLKCTSNHNITFYVIEESEKEATVIAV